MSKKIFEIGLVKQMTAHVFIEAETEEEAMQIVRDGNFDESFIDEDYDFDNEFTPDGYISDVTKDREDWECANHDDLYSDDEEDC